MAIKELHVLTPVLLLPFIIVMLLFQLQMRVPGIAALLIPDGLVSLWVYYDSRALSLRYPREWEQAGLASPFWLGVTALIFAPLGLPLYTYQLSSLNSCLKQTA